MPPQPSAHRRTFRPASPSTRQRTTLKPGPAPPSSTLQRMASSAGGFAGGWTGGGAGGGAGGSTGGWTASLNVTHTTRRPSSVTSAVRPPARPCGCTLYRPGPSGANSHASGPYSALLPVRWTEPSQPVVHSRTSTPGWPLTRQRTTPKPGPAPPSLTSQAQPGAASSTTASLWPSTTMPERARLVSATARSYAPALRSAKRNAPSAAAICSACQPSAGRARRTSRPPPPRTTPRMTLLSGAMIAPVTSKLAAAAGRSRVRITS
ncbi:MAG: hypothetical protein BWY52_02396 [Chloroflexi bacterium ADurb.Bin325]|nr:MAG: hypothetical protein BWY52_02396 [Chloroflexi bacterium ADurb.Bin325]